MFIQQRLEAWNHTILPHLSRSDIVSFDIKLSDDYALVILTHKDSSLEHYSYIYREGSWENLVPISAQDESLPVYVHALTDLFWLQTRIALYLGVSQSTISKIQVARTLSEKAVPKEPGIANLASLASGGKRPGGNRVHRLNTRGRHVVPNTNIVQKR
jgi:hypothetical protein